MEQAYWSNANRTHWRTLAPRLSPTSSSSIKTLLAGTVIGAAEAGADARHLVNAPPKLKTKSARAANALPSTVT